MKNILKQITAVFLLLMMVNCQDDNVEFGALTAPTNLQVKVDIIGKTAATPDGDGTGKVLLTAKADNAISYKYIFSDGTSENAPSGIFEKAFTKPGVNTYTVTVLASGKGGITTNTTIEVKVLSTFKDEEAVQFLTGGSSKKWYWSQSEQGHLGVGPNAPSTDANFGQQNYYPAWYTAAPDEKASTCLYNSVMTFSKEGDQLKFNLDNKGDTYYNAGYLGGGDDRCQALDTKGLKTVLLSPSDSFVSKNPNAASQTRGTVLNISDNGFMGYFIGTSKYEILSITDNRMVVRAVQGNNSMLAWYHIFTTTPPGAAGPTDYTKLVWSDEFDKDGAPDDTKWGYDLGAGGWGNGEAQTYTNKAENVKVEGGVLKITARKDGANFTSARIKTLGKYSFKYGKIEFKAKMAKGGGTWPAVWSLGSDFPTVGWPACGEIDFLEYVGNKPNDISSALHFPGNSGGGALVGRKTIQNAETEFHVYKTIWSPASIKFYVDNELYFSYANSANTVFNKEFFLIMNVAMGGSLGGTIDPLFTQGTMEVDYIRVYQ